MNSTFIIICIVILIIFNLFKINEKFDSSNQSQPNVGLYNYFFQSYMNPYPLPLNKFFSNDKEGEVKK